MSPVEIVAQLHQSQIDEAVALIDEITSHDGLSPISEHVFLHLRHGGDAQGLHFLKYENAQLIAYAHLDVTDKVEGPSAEIAVAPEFRRQGLGTEIIQALVTAAPDGNLRLWAHGEQSVSGQWAKAMGFDHARSLWQMRRSLLAPLPPASFGDDVILRTFIPSQDDDEWVALNARAFAGHDEQGDWTLADLHRRMAEPWFSIPGFLVAQDRDTGTMLGFHWTKIHGEIQVTPDHPHAHDAIGEVYVVGVDPTLQGRGLGKALTLAGLHHLRSCGLVQSMLYVDASNTSAISLYEALGFSRWDVDVMYRHGSVT